MRRTITAIVTLVASTVLLAGCGDENDPDPTTPSTATPSPTAKPTASPEDQAEAAAWQAYLRYLEVDDRLARTPSTGLAGKLAPTVATNPQRRYMVIVASNAAKSGERLIGGKSVPTRMGVNVRDLGEVVVGVCLDNSATDFVDKNGKSIVKAGHPEKVKVTMTLKKVKGVWLVSDQDGGTEPC